MNRLLHASHHAVRLAAALSVAFAGMAAMAQEPTQFEDTPSSASRAEVKIDRAAMPGSDAVAVKYGEATEFVDVARAGHGDRTEVRAQARAAAHRQHLTEDNVGG
jgi:hypothetical protein